MYPTAAVMMVPPTFRMASGVAYTEPDSEAIRDSLRTLLGDAARRESLGAAGYARSQEFTWEASAEAHMASYRRAAEQTAADVTAV